MLKKYDRIVVEVSLNADCRKLLSSLQHSPIIEGAHSIHLVHTYNSKMSGHLPSTVDAKDIASMREYITGLMEETRKLITSKTTKGKVELKCIFDNNDKIATINYLKEVKADLVIAATRGNQDVEGIFCDSFSVYLVGHSPCDVYVIRPTN